MLSELKRPRNDAYIIYPNYRFESLRTAYNRQKQSKMQSEVTDFKLDRSRTGPCDIRRLLRRLIDPLCGSISIPRNDITPHNFPTSLSQAHNTLHI